MKTLLFLLPFFTFFSVAQYPLHTSNWHFQETQQDLMLKLGKHKVNSKLVGKYTSNGFVFQTEQKWEDFDSLGRMVRRGFKNGGVDTMTFETYYSETGKYLGNRDFNYKRPDILFGREYIYNEEDFLIENKFRYGQEIDKYEWEQIDDSTYWRTTFSNDPTTMTMTEGRKSKFIYGKQSTTEFTYVEDEMVSTMIEKTDTAGRLISRTTKGKYSDQEERIQYNERGDMTSRKFIYRGVVTGERIKTYNSQGFLIKEEIFTKGKLTGMHVYTFTGNKLIKEVTTTYHPGWEESYTFTFTYYSNGLMQSLINKIPKHGIVYTYYFSYD